ncbi:MAG: diguanylate cyclase [Ruminococcus sp.]|nr:diguanylate cyclase [Ruminococcus sp.]
MSTLNIVLIIQLIIMLGLSIFITLTVSDKTKQNAIDHMKAITDERAAIIESFVQNAEKTLTYYSKGKEIVDMFKNPTKPEYKAAAQAYTEAFGKEIEYNEGLWSGLLTTEVMTHSSAPQNPKVIGMVTRSKRDADGNVVTDENGKQVPDDARVNQLLDALKTAGPNGVYNTGIIISPASQKQCLSLYKGVFDGDNLIGFVGLGIFTEGLIDTLDKIPLSGIENSFYNMVNVKDKTYIFNVDSAKIGSEPEHKELVDLCDKYAERTDADNGDFEYSQDSKSYVSIYSYMPQYGWILTIDDETSEVFSLMRTMIIYLSIFAFIILCLTVVFYFITKRQQKINEKLVSTIAKANRTKKSLNTAMFKDVLTGANNRISLSMDIDKIDQNSGEPYFFAMFNIINFSEINSQYGNDSGDRILVRAVEDMKEFFEEEQIYRTGSDKFVVAVKTQDGMPLNEGMLEKVNNALRQMSVPEKLEDGRSIYPKYRVAVIKKTRGIDLSVVTVLKDMSAKSGEASYGMIDIREM